MPLRIPDPVQPTVMNLLEPFGYAMIAWAGSGLLSIDMILVPTEPLATAAEVRAYAHGRATEALNHLEASGYQVSESEVTIKGRPMECTMRIQVIEPT